MYDSRITLDLIRLLSRRFRNVQLIEAYVLLRTGNLDTRETPDTAISNPVYTRIARPEHRKAPWPTRSRILSAVFKRKIAATGRGFPVIGGRLTQNVDFCCKTRPVTAITSSHRHRMPAFRGLKVASAALQSKSLCTGHQRYQAEAPSPRRNPRFMVAFLWPFGRTLTLVGKHNKIDFMTGVITVPE